MESAKINGVPYFVYADEPEFRTYHPDEPLAGDWRTAPEGAWVRADDGGIVQILRVSGGKNNIFLVRTIVGTFATTKNAVMDTQFAMHLNRYTVSNVRQQDRAKRRLEQPLSAKDMLIVHHMLKGMDPELAIRRVRGRGRKTPLSPYTVRMKVQELLKDRRIIDMIKDAVKEAAHAMKISPQTLISRLDELSKHADKDATRLAATQELVALMDLRPEKAMGRMPFGGITSRDSGQIADAEFQTIDTTVRKGLRASEGKTLTSGYDNQGS